MGYDGDFNFTFGDCIFFVSDGFEEFKEYCNYYNILPQYTYYNEIVSVDVTEDVEQSITTSMYNAWQQTWDLPIFNWSYDSFLNVPLQYLGDLFGIPQYSSVLAPMSYWLAISVIWLVFDVVMYVPLLAHRWIDKARIE